MGRRDDGRGPTHARRRPGETGQGLPNLQDLKDRYDRKARVIANRPELARSTGHARVRVVGEAAWAVDEHAGGAPSHPIATDEPSTEAPTPAALLRASLAGSLALGYRQWSARLEIPIDDVEVELHTDDDARGQLVLDTDVAPGWQRIHVTVTLTTLAPEADVHRLIACANRHCLVLATLSPAIERVHELHLVRPA